MKIFVVVSVAKQTDGDGISIRFERGFKDRTKAEAYANNLNKTYMEKIQTQYGLLDFFCERAVQEIDVED